MKFDDAAEILTTLTISLLLVSCASPSSQSIAYSDAPSSFTLNGVSVLDVVTGELLENRSVSVDQGRIVRIGKSVMPASADSANVGQEQALSPSESDISPDLQIDATGKYLVPGLIDSHVHIYSVNDLHHYVINGVTSVQNMWGLEGWVTGFGFPNSLALKKQVEQGGYGPTIRTAGPILEGVPRTSPLMRSHNDVETIGEVVRKQSVAGYDFIKPYDNLKQTFFWLPQLLQSTTNCP